MDKVQFENSCVYSEDVLREWYVEYVKKQLVIGCIVYVVFLVFNLIRAIAQRDSTFFIQLIAGVAIAILFMCCLWGAKKQAKAVYLKRKKLYNKPQEDRTTFYEDHVSSINLLTNAELDIPYDQIKSICETKHLYILKYQKKVYLLIHKDGFLTGTKQEFIQFIHDKKIKVRHSLTEWYE